MSKLTLKMRWLILKIAYKRWRLGDRLIPKQQVRTALSWRRQRNGPEDIG